MSPPEDISRLQDMLEHACPAVDAVRGRRRADLDADILFRAAVERLVEIIGEAASQVSESCQRTLPDVPWRQIVAMRNRLIHGYGAVDLDVLWDVVREDLPKLIAHLERELGWRA